MAEENTDVDVGGDSPGDVFTTDAVEANRDIHMGLGVGARELAAQRDAHGAQATPELPLADTEGDLGDEDADNEEDA